MHEVLVNRLGGLSLPRKSVVRLTDRPDMTLDVYRGRKTTMQQQLVCGRPTLALSSALVYQTKQLQPKHHTLNKNKIPKTLNIYFYLFLFIYLFIYFLLKA